MKILKNSEYEELKQKERENNELNKFISNGFKAMNICLDFEKVIVQLLKDNCIREIEIPKSYILNEETIAVCDIPQHNAYSIRVEKNER